MPWLQLCKLHLEDVNWTSLQYVCTAPAPLTLNANAHATILQAVLAQAFGPPIHTKWPTALEGYSASPSTWALHVGPCATQEALAGTAACKLFGGEACCSAALLCGHEGLSTRVIKYSLVSCGSGPRSTSFYTSNYQTLGRQAVKATRYDDDRLFLENLSSEAADYMWIQ